MALSGSFSNLVSGNFGLICEWNGVQSQSGNYTEITLDVYLQYYHISVGARSDGTASINGKSTTFSIVTNENKILETEIVSFDMNKTLFSEVYNE